MCGAEIECIFTLRAYCHGHDEGPVLLVSCLMILCRALSFFFLPRLDLTWSTHLLAQGCNLVCVSLVCVSVLHASQPLY